MNPKGFLWSDVRRGCRRPDHQSRLAPNQAVSLRPHLRACRPGHGRPGHGALQNVPRNSAARELATKSFEFLKPFSEGVKG